MDFKLLLKNLHETHDFMQNRAVKIVNQSHTLRNWLYGFYIVEFEQNGEDYAQYGSGLLKRIASELKKGGIKGIAYTNLTLFRKFYLQYLHIGLAVKTIPELNIVDKNAMRIFQTPSEIFKSEQILPPDFLLAKLSFSHFVELLKVEDPLQRLFYEVECIKGNWTRMQLQRQIGTLLYERTGLSKNKEALLDHLQDFLLELGTGFCFEARQKSFLIDNRRYKVDLLFYHRILKCHVMIDLKTHEFTHEDAGQMNFYLNHHIDNEMQEGDNPPIGIILCSVKNETIVRYATGSLDNQIFVSKYMLQLPDEKTLLNFINKEKRYLLDISKSKNKQK